MGAISAYREWVIYRIAKWKYFFTLQAIDKSV